MEGVSSGCASIRQLKVAISRGILEIVAVNDLVPAQNLAYLLRFDSVHGRAPCPVAV